MTVNACKGQQGVHTRLRSYGISTRAEEMRALLLLVSMTGLWGLK